MNSLNYSLILLLVLLCGCAPSPHVSSIDGSPLEKISAIEASHLYAVDPAGERVVFSYRGLSLLKLGSDEKQVISLETPTAVAWSRDGRQFSAVFPLPEGQTLLSVYSPAGFTLYETILPVIAGNMAWTVNGEILVSGYSLKVYSFGANLSQSLAVIKNEKVRFIQLTDTTLNPATTKALQPVLQDVLPVLFSPLGDELIYVRLHDPPEFSPYLNVLYKNWQADGARKLLELPLQVVEVGWAGPDLVEVAASGGPHRIDLWPSSVASEKDNQGYRFNAGRLSRGETLLADWGPDAIFEQITGGRFLLASGKSLYLGAGLAPEFPAEHGQNEWRLRRWRYQGLISSEEFQALLLEDEN